MIKAIIFDVDGVLFDSINSNGKFLWSSTVKEDLGLNSLHFQNIFSKNWNLLATGKLSTIEYLDNVFSATLFLDLNLTSNKFIEYWLAKDRFVNRQMINYVKTIEIPKYIATNQDSHRSKHIKNLVGQHFDEIFASYKIGHIKPEDQFYAYVEEQLKLSGDEILFIDDMVENVEAANRRGWLGYHYQNDFDSLDRFIQKGLKRV